MNTPSEQTVVMDYYSRIADRYDADMAVPDTERLRRCFWKLAAAHLPPRGRLLDFGCGTGIDAQHFAAAGHEVVAYDLSPGMLRVLGERCRAEIGQGLVHPLGGTLMDLEEAIRARRPLDGVICNFAVLNLVADPKPIFRLLGRVVHARGTLILSLLNPWYLGELKSGAFWRGLPHAWRTGAAVVYQSMETRHTYRHLAGSMVRAAAPEFRRIPVTARELAPDCAGAKVGRFDQFRLLVFERM